MPPGIDSEMMKKWFREDPERMQEIEGRMIEDKLIDWIAENGEVTAESLSLQELLDKGADA